MKDVEDKLAGVVIHCILPLPTVTVVTDLHFRCRQVSLPHAHFSSIAHRKQNGMKITVLNDLQDGPGLAQHLSNEATRNTVQGQYSFK